MMNTLPGLLPFVLAHHPFGMGDGALTPLQGLLSGIGHPLLGPDHLLFLIALSLVSWKQPRNWLPALLAVGLLGSATALVLPIPEAFEVSAEALVSLTLVLEGLVVLGTFPRALLFPAFALHGWLLGGAIIGAEPTPLIGYFLGLFVAQGALLLLVRQIALPLQSWLGESGRRLLAGIWIGIGAAFAWSMVIA